MLRQGVQAGPFRHGGFLASNASRRCCLLFFPARLFKHNHSEVNENRPPDLAWECITGRRHTAEPSVTFLPRPQRANLRTTTWFHPSAQGRSACGPTLGNPPQKNTSPHLRLGGEGPGVRRPSNATSLPIQAAATELIVTPSLGGDGAGDADAPHRPEDVLKVDCDEEGVGGDDAAHCLRYLVATKGRTVTQRKLRGV